MTIPHAITNSRIIFLDNPGDELMPTFDAANHRHKWGVQETAAHRELRQERLADYVARRKRIEEAAAAVDRQAVKGQSA
jgi:hypothetical protein